MTRVSFGVTVGALVLAGSLAVSAQAPQAPAGPGQGRGAGRGAPQPPPANLQVLPKDMTRQQVVQIMQQINAGLGSTCATCHVFIANGDPMNDFASDAKPQKNVARAMMRMVAEINAAVPTAVSKPADQAARVGCATCHRGALIPVVAPGTPGAPPPPPAAAPGGAPGGAPPAGRGN